MPQPGTGSTEASALIPKGFQPDVEAEQHNDRHYETVPRSAGDPADLEDQDGDVLTRQLSAEDRSKQYQGMPDVKKRMAQIFPALVVGVFLSAADQTIIVSSAGKIGTDLKALNQSSWIATAYFLTLTSFQPLYGKLSDIFSRKSCLLFAYLVFGVGTLCCGLAQTMIQLIVARAFAGIGGGGMTTVVSIILSDIIPLQDRGVWQGYINIVYAAGAGFGAPMGGLLAEKIGWRWAFLGQAPLCLVAFISVSVALKLPQKEGSHWREKLRRVDFLGAACIVAAVFALLFGLDRGSNVAWGAKVALVPLCLSVPLFGAFILVELKVAAEPFAPGHIIFQKGLFACYMCNFFSFAGYMAAYFYIPAVDGHSATKAGLLLLPSVVAGVSGSLFGGLVMKKTGKLYWLTVVAYGLLTVGMVIIALCSGVLIRSDLGICVGGFISGFGNGIGVTSSLIGLISNCKRDEQAVATACSYLFRTLGSTSGVSLSSSVVNQALRLTLERELGGKEGIDFEQIAEGVRQSLEYIRTLKPAVQGVVRYCYMLSVHGAFALEIILVFGAFFSAWFIKEKPLSR